MKAKSLRWPSVNQSRSENSGRITSDPRGIGCEFLRPNPAIRPGVRQVERKHAAVQHLIVKTTDVESGAQLHPRTVTQFAELQLTQLVREGLRRPRDVAIRFRLDGRLVDGPRFSHELDHLVAIPTLRMDAGIDYQPHGAEQLAGESPIVAGRVLVEAHFLAELLG